MENVQNKHIWSEYEELYTKDGLRTSVRRYNYTGDLSYQVDGKYLCQVKNPCREDPYFVSYRTILAYARKV